jgi:hypothetical protein
MKKRYIIKDLKTGLYYAGDFYGWGNEVGFSNEYYTKGEALITIETFPKGWYEVITIYTVE